VSDNFPVIHRDLTLLTPIAQDGLPVPLADWNDLQERITKINSPTAHLEAFWWAAIGASISFFAVAISLPFSVDWSKIVANVEHVKLAGGGNRGRRYLSDASFLGCRRTVVILGWREAKATGQNGRMDRTRYGGVSGKT